MLFQYQFSTYDLPVGDRSYHIRAANNFEALVDVMFEREWIYGSQVKVEVCMGCSGVWLDEGELDDLARYLGTSW